MGALVRQAALSMRELGGGAIRAGLLSAAPSSRCAPSITCATSAPSFTADTHAPARRSLRVAEVPARVLAARRSAIVKGVHRCGQRGYVDLVVAGSPDGNQRHAESTPFLGLEAAQLDAIARRCGGGEVACFGGYRGEPYERETSTDLIMAVRKG
jgi:hypothetical protein